MSPRYNYKVQPCLQGTTTKFNYVSKVQLQSSTLSQGTTTKFNYVSMVQLQSYYVSMVQLQSSTMSPRYNYKVQLCLQGTTTKFNHVSKVQLQSSTLSQGTTTKFNYVSKVQLQSSTMSPGYNHFSLSGAYWRFSLGRWTFKARHPAPHVSNPLHFFSSNKTFLKCGSNI